MSSLPCDVVLLPSPELAAKAIDASKLLEEFDSLFTLKDGEFYAHMSLYMFQLDEESIGAVKEVLVEIARNANSITATATIYRLGEGFGIGYIDPEYEVTDELSSVQEKVVSAINPIRAGMREKDVAKMQDATGLKLENLQKYGYPAIGELFRPHITLTRLKDHKPEALNALPDINQFSGVFDRIGLFEMGDNGTCIRKIAEYRLRNSNGS